MYHSTIETDTKQPGDPTMMEIFVEPRMSTKDHAAVFNAYLSRLSLNDIEAIHSAIKKSWHASFNLGMSSQIDAQNKERKTVEDILENRFLSHDLVLVESIIKDRMKKNDL